MATLNDVKANLARIDADMQRIAHDPDLSEEGRARRSMDLRRQREELKLTASDVLNKEWEKVKRVAQRAGEDYQKASEDEARGWDYQQLNYERARAHDKIRMLSHQSDNNVAAVDAEFKRVQREDGRHTQRAWSESAGLVSELFGRDEKHGDLVRRMGEHAAALTTSPDMAAAQARSSANVKAAVELRNVTRDFNRAFNGGFGQGGVEIEERLNSHLGIDAQLIIPTA